MPDSPSRLPPLLLGLIAGLLCLVVYLQVRQVRLHCCSQLQAWQCARTDTAVRVLCRRTSCLGSMTSPPAQPLHRSTSRVRPAPVGPLQVLVCCPLSR